MALQANIRTGDCRMESAIASIHQPYVKFGVPCGRQGRSLAAQTGRRGRSASSVLRAGGKRRTWQRAGSSRWRHSSAAGVRAGRNRFGRCRRSSWHLLLPLFGDGRHRHPVLWLPVKVSPEGPRRRHRSTRCCRNRARCPPGCVRAEVGKGDRIDLDRASSRCRNVDPPRREAPGKAPARRR